MEMKFYFSVVANKNIEKEVESWMDEKKKMFEALKMKEQLLGEKFM